MKRNGHTAAGTQRWRCKACNASTTYNYRSDNKFLESFIHWLFSQRSQNESGIESRTFRRHVSAFWAYWPLPPIHEAQEEVIHVDGLYLARNVVILIACSEQGPIGWYLARSENSNAWAALLGRIRAPVLVITDGGTGFEKARKKLWPHTKVQRCNYHVFCQIKRLTTTRPQLLAGKELYALAKDLLHISTHVEAKIWVQRYLHWSCSWDSFLREKTYDEHKHWVYTHERLHRARSGINRLLSQNVLFTYLEKPAYPSTNNRIEGGVNAQLRAMLRSHRGMPLMHRIKAVFWWCYIHSPSALAPTEALKTFPTDNEIAAIYKKMTAQERTFDEIPRWGDAIVWSEMHHSAPFFSRWD